MCLWGTGFYNLLLFLIGLYLRGADVSLCLSSIYKWLSLVLFLLCGLCLCLLTSSLIFLPFITIHSFDFLIINKERISLRLPYTHFIAHSKASANHAKWIHSHITRNHLFIHLLMAFIWSCMYFLPFYWRGLFCGETHVVAIAR